MSSSANHVIVHHFGARISEALAARWPKFSIVAVEMGSAWNLPDETSILLCGPSKLVRPSLPQKPEPWPRGLQWVQLAAAGVDGYPKWLLQHPLVTTARGVNSIPIAEFAMASILAQAKGFPSTWVKRPDDWQELHLDTLDGKTLGLIGVGSIGTQVARRALAFGMRVVAWRRSSSEPMPEAVARAASLHDLLNAADHLVLALPHTAETHQLIDRTALAAMKPGAHLVNVARGGLIDQEALLEALDSGRIAGASLDVTEPEPLPAGHPLYVHPKVRLSPHMSWSGPGTIDRLVNKFNDNLARLIEGKPLLDAMTER